MTLASLGRTKRCGQDASSPWCVAWFECVGFVCVAVRLGAVHELLEECLSQFWGLAGGERSTLCRLCRRQRSLAVGTCDAK